MDTQLFWRVMQGPPRAFGPVRMLCVSRCVQGDEDPYGALSCGFLSAKEPLIIGLFCDK